MQRVNSGGAGVVFKRDFDEYTGSTIYKIEILVYILAALFIAVRAIADRQSGEEPSLFWWNALFLLSITAPICNVPVFMTVPITRDKLNGTVASLLATPLSPEAIIRGKSRAVFLPGFLPAFFAPLLLLTTRFFIGSALRVTQVTPASFFTVCVVSPLFCYGLTKLSVQLSMIYSPDFATFPSYLIGIVIAFGVPVCTATGILDLISWNFLLLFLAVTLVLWVIVAGLSGLLTKERIIKSCLK